MVAALEAAARTEADPNARPALLLALGRTGRREAIAPLLAVLEEGNLWARAHALEALGEIGDPAVAPRLIPLLDHAPLRKAALRALARLDSSAAGEELARRAGSGECDEALLSALRRAAESSPSETLQDMRAAFSQAPSVLASLASDPDASSAARTDAAHLLAVFQIPGAAATIVRSGPFDDGFAALGALGSSRFDDGLFAVLQEEDPEPALALIAGAETPHEKKRLAPLLVHPAAVVRAAAISALPPGGAPLSDLLRVLEEDDPYTALPAAFAIAVEQAGAAPQESQGRRQALLDRARGNDGPARAASLLALSEAPGPDSDEVILAALLAADIEVRCAAVTAAASSLDLPEDALRARLVDDDASVRAATLRTLARWAANPARELGLTWRDVLPSLADELVVAAAAGGAVIALGGQDRARLVDEMLGQSGPIRRCAFEEIARTDDPDAADRAAAFAGHEDAETAQAALAALVMAHREAAEPSLARALADARAAVRQSAAESISRRGVAETFEGALPAALAAALASEMDSLVRPALLEAIAVAGGESAVEPVTVVLAAERSLPEAERAADALARRFPAAVKRMWSRAPARAERRWARALTRASSTAPAAPSPGASETPKE
jgi:hypothetical protein